jgi:hypothetical protein
MVTIPPKLRENIAKLFGFDDSEDAGSEVALTTAMVALADYAAASLIKDKDAVDRELAGGRARGGPQGRQGGGAESGDEQERKDLLSVALGPLTADQEHAIGPKSGASQALAQPLTVGLLHSTGIWADKRTLSDQLIKIFKVSAKTWEAGIPRRPKKRQQVC